MKLVAAVGMVATLAGLAPMTAGAEPAGPRNVVASGRAQGFRATYTVPDYVIVSEFFDGGGPVTDAVTDSTGRATSFASLPWPGENAVTAPGHAVGGLRPVGPAGLSVLRAGRPSDDAVG